MAKRLCYSVRNIIKPLLGQNFVIRNCVRVNDPDIIQVAENTEPRNPDPDMIQVFKNTHLEELQDDRNTADVIRVLEHSEPRDAQLKTL